MPTKIFALLQEIDGYTDWIAEVNYGSKAHGVQFHLTHATDDNTWYITLTQEDGLAGEWEDVPLTRPVTADEAAMFLALERPVWQSYAITFTVDRQTHVWIRFAATPEHATASAREALEDFHGKAILLSVEPCPDPRAQNTENQ